MGVPNASMCYARVVKWIISKMGHRSGERGFASTLIIILAVAVIAAIACAAYNYAKDRNNTHSVTAISKSTPTPVASASPTAPPSTTHSPAPSTTTVFGEAVPSDFGNYITSVYASQKAKCAATTFSIGSPVVRDQFAVVNESCGAGSAVFYAKVDGQWQQAFGSQNLPECSDVDKYSFTKELVAECFSSTGSVVTNTNP